jgi:hypothetical protein
VLGDWPNTYSFTKNLAEDVIREEARGLPIGIIRPSIGKYNKITMLAFRRSRYRTTFPCRKLCVSENYKPILMTTSQ